MRAILHSDLNSFYASVEMMLDPKLRGKAVAVCGSTEERHGIVLAKSELAKRAGVKTGMANWEARKACKDLIMVPPQYEQYLKYSKLTQAIYQRYTDLIEPFGMDECWLDVTSWSMNERKEFAVSVPSTYLYYRLNISSNQSGTDTSVSEVELLEGIPYGFDSTAAEIVSSAPSL